MPFSRVDHYEAISPVLDHYFNKPTFTFEFTEEAFEEEYSAAYTQVFECLEAAETAMSDLAEEAFTMGPPFAPDRRIGVVVGYIDLLNADLLHQLQAILTGIPEGYVITIDGSDRETPHYYITLSKKDVIGYAESKVARGFGVSMKDIDLRRTILLKPEFCPDRYTPTEEDQGA
jgi:hypothetical protein